MSELKRLVTPAVSTEYIKFGEDAMYEFVFDLEKGLFTYQFEDDDFSYFDHDIGQWIPMTSRIIGVYDINTLKSNNEFIFDNTVDLYKFRSAAFDFFFFFKDEADMLRFKKKLYQIIYPEIDANTANKLGIY